VLVESSRFTYCPLKLKQLHEWQDFSVTVLNTARENAELDFNFFIPLSREELYFDNVDIPPERD
jgi:hypothetical protein